MTNKPKSASPVFPKAGLDFLKRLKRNNNRDWFLKNKAVYEDSVQEPMVQLVEALADEFRRFAPEIAATPKQSLFRIYRDTRFSKDKSPYKTHVAASFRARGLDRHEGAGFYFHIAPTELWIGGGLWRPETEILRHVREHIAGNHQRLAKIVSGKTFRKFFGGLSGEQSSRVPRGYAANHPAERFLRYKDLIAARALAPEEATKPKFVAILAETFEAMHPLVRFINEPILRLRRLKARNEQFLL